ncbi:MAG: prephenate dehydrogenase [Phycisphaerales bacterium]|nr:prephenate dehydrogenase [Planctomycetota bacterium]MCH8509514.1 prephenate dehydrogenase [Phycisphaerales bacterium]
MNAAQPSPSPVGTIAPPLTTVALVGLGAFGRLAAECIKPHAEVLVHDPKTDDDTVRGLGVRPVGLEDAARAEAVILCVPVQVIPVVCVSLAPSLAEGALVCDVGSVKLRPVEWMLDTLPKHAQVLGTHPLFGPQTAAELGGVAGEPIALCRARVEDATYARVRAFLEQTLSLRVLEITPDEHDQQMAFVQGLTHLIGRAACEVQLPELPTATLAYKRLLQLKCNTECDAPELFEAIEKLNPYAKNARQAFIKAIEEVAGSMDKA